MPRLDQLLEILEKSNYSYALMVAKEIRVNLSEYVAIVSRAEIVRRLIASGTPPAKIGNVRAFVTDKIYLNEELPNEALAVSLFHESMHAMGIGELRTFMRTARFAEAAGLTAYLAAEKKFVEFFAANDVPAPGPKKAGEDRVRQAFYYLQGLFPDYGNDVVMSRVKVGDRVKAVLADSSRSIRKG